MVKIAPSILSADFGKLGDEIRAVEKAGADWIHIDVMDGHFVPNLTVGPAVVEAVNQATDLPLDVHLMIENPDKYVGEFVEAGADILTVHVEACAHLNRSIQNIKDHKVRAGVVVNPATSLSLLEEIINDVDLVLLMSVNPGFGGQKFIPSVLDKIQCLREIIDACGGGIDLEVDGGITTENVRSIKEAGANVLVAGSAIFNGKNYKKTIAKLRSA
ncbi:MAG: ribulose-phosphate 3-epimerase [Nitrospinales bacterium]